ncbi:MAG: hypothetical protein NTY33_04940, partial [Candidatus Moranbacteria bacterium]|nr:hypothetical protein [Candidatus Moranbacteria bacterium]
IAGLKENATDSNVAGYLAFYSRAAGAAPAENMRITSTGNVGIGTTGPGKLLQVGSGTVSSVGAGTKIAVVDATEVAVSAISGTQDTTYLYSTSGKYGVNAYSYGSSAYLPVSIGWGGTANVLLAQNGGNVGIGTTNPTVKLDTAGVIRSISNDAGWPSSGTGLELTYDTGDATGYVVSYDRTGSVYKPLQLYGSSISLMQGNVGIGTTAPGALLDVNVGNNNGTMYGIRTTGTWPSFQIYSTLADAATRNWGLLANNYGYGDFGIYQSNAKGGDPATTASATVRLLIKNDGNVGIGTDRC